MIAATIALARDGFALDVDFAAEAPVVGVFGPSGSGKTTLVHAIAGLERPDRGTIRVADRVLLDRARGVDVPVHRRRIGVVFQEHRLFPHRSVRGNLLYGAPRDGGGADAVIELLELAPLLRRRPHELSGGERQRVALGRALLSDPAVLLLDEPLASLDLRLRRQILPYLRRVRDELHVPMLLVSHDLAELLQLTDHLLLLDGGRVVGHGRFADLLHDHASLALLRERGLCSVVPARVVEHQPDAGTSLLELVDADGAATGTRLVAPIASAAPGAAVSIALHPGDVALAAAPVPGVSIRNQLPGTVARCTAHPRGVMVEIDLGTPIAAEISRGSADALGIRPGAAVVCLVKSHAIRYP